MSHVCHHGNFWKEIQQKWVAAPKIPQTLGPARTSPKGGGTWGDCGDQTHHNPFVSLQVHKAEKFLEKALSFRELLPGL